MVAKAGTGTSFGGNIQKLVPEARVRVPVRGQSGGGVAQTYDQQAQTEDSEAVVPRRLSQ